MISSLCVQENEWSNAHGKVLSVMEWYVAGVAGLFGVLDAITTHVGLKGGVAAEANPLWRRLYPRLPLAGFVALLGGGQFVLSMLIFLVLGDIGQMSHAAVALLPPVTNAVVIARARKRR